MQWFTIAWPHLWFPLFAQPQFSQLVIVFVRLQFENFQRIILLQRSSLPRLLDRDDKTVDDQYWSLVLHLFTWQNAFLVHFIVVCHIVLYDQLWFHSYCGAQVWGDRFVWQFNQLWFVSPEHWVSLSLFNLPVAISNLKLFSFIILNHRNAWSVTKRTYKQVDHSLEVLVCSTFIKHQSGVYANIPECRDSHLCDKIVDNKTGSIKYVGKLVRFNKWAFEYSELLRLAPLKMKAICCLKQIY